MDRATAPPSVTAGEPQPAGSTRSHRAHVPPRIRPHPVAPPSATFLPDGAARSPEEFARGIRHAIDVLAPMLGIDPARVRVTLSPAAGAPHASAAPEAITLTGTIDPAAAGTRSLLVHELAHTRQHTNRERFRRAEPNVSAAEAEAAGLAAALREGRTLWVPRHALPDGHRAHDTGAAGTTPLTKNPADTATTPDVAGLEKTLDTLVARNHSGDARMIAGLLDHPWTQTTDGMIENCLRILTALEFVVARALVRALDQSVRLHLAMLRDSHHQEYPDACIAVLSALTVQEFALLSEQRAGERRYPGATTALHGVEPTRLSAVARRALLATLRKLPVSTLLDLEHSDRRDVFRALFASGPDTGTDEADLRRAIADETKLSELQRSGAGALLLQRLTTLLRSPNADEAEQALTALAKVKRTAQLSSPQDQPAVAPPGTAVTLDDLRAAVAKPSAPGAGSNAPPATTPGLVALVARLDADGLIGKLLDELPEQDRYNETYGNTLKSVLAARSPAPNLSRATELLSYGLFDWKIFDAEARFAYLLVRSTPIPYQDSWRALDNGKWLHRLEDNLPDDLVASGEYTGVGSEYVPPGSTDLGVPPRLLQAYAGQFVARWERLKIGPVAKAIVRELLGLDVTGKPKPWLTGAKAAKSDPALRMAIIRRVDARLVLDDIIAGLPDDYLFGEQGRIELLDLNQLRDPVHLVQQARDLVPTGFFGRITYTHRDAWIAAQAVRGLSPAAQQRLAIENPDLWASIWNGLTDDMRRALPTTLATGHDPKLPTRQAIRDRLSDERLWTQAMAPQLRALIDLAYAADDRAWVFGKSRQLRADKRKGLAAIVREFRLYDEASQHTVYVPDLTEASHAPVWGHTLGVIGRAIGILAYDWLIEDSISLSGKTMHLKGFDLGDAQQISGGDLGGLTLAPSRGGANQINVDATFHSGFIVNVDLKDLEIAGVNIILPGKSYRSGPVSVKGLKATAGFSDRHYRQPAYIGVTLGSLALRDLVLVDPALPLSGAWAIAYLALRTLAFRATESGTGDPVARIGQHLPEGTIPIPVWGRLFQMLSNIVAIKGAIPFDQTLLDFALMPLQLPFPTSSLVAAGADYLVPTPAPATNLWGLATDGVLRPPYSAAQRIKDAVGMLRAFSVAFNSLHIDGISIGTGLQIASLTLTDVNLSLGQSLPAYLHTALATVQAAQSKLPKDSPQYKALGTRIAALRAQIASVEATPRLTALRAKRARDPGSLTEAEKAELALADDKSSDEARLAELEARDRWHPGSLTEPERRQLVELTKRLRAGVGVSAEIGSITLGPLSGAVQAAGVSLKGIHATARVPNVGLLPYAAGYLDDKSLVEQFVRGGPKIPAVGELAKSSEFSLVVDSTTILSTDPEQPALVLKATHIPRAYEVKRQLDALPQIEGNKPIRERLCAAYDTLVALERAKGTAQSAPRAADRAAAVQRVPELTDEAARLLGIEIGGITFGRITGELDPRTGTLTATVHDTELTKVAGPGFAVGKLTGSLRLGLRAGGVRARPGQLKSTDPDTLAGQLAPSLGLENVTATGVSFARGSIASAKLGRLSGSLQATGTGFRIPDLRLDRLEIDGVALGTEGDGITAKAVTVGDLAMDAEVSLQKTQAGTKVTRAVIHSLSIGSLGGEHVEFDGGSVRAELVGGALHDIRGAEIVFAEGSDGFALLSGSAEMGSFADVRYAVTLGALTSRRTAVTGTLSTAKQAVTAKRPAITARYATEGGRRFSLSLADLEALGTDISTPDGHVTIRKVALAGKLTGTEAGMKASATLTGLTIGPIDWTAGTGRLKGSGPVIAHKVTVAAVYTPAVPARGRQKAKPAAWSVTDVVITGLSGHDLHYTDPPIDMHLGRDGKPTVPGQAPLTIGRIHIRPRQGTVQVDDLSVGFGGALRKSLDVSGHLGIDSFSMQLHRHGHVVAVVRGVSADVTATGDYTGTVEVKGLEGATIDVGPGAIRIGGTDPNDPTGVHIDQITLSSLTLKSVMGGHHFTLSTQQDGRVDLLGIHAKVRIDKWLPGEKHKTKSPFKQIAIERLYIDKIDLSAFQLDLPDDNITIVVPARTAGDPPTVHGLDLYGGVGKDGLLHSEFLINLETGALEGGVSVTGIALPISAAIKKTISGDALLTTKSSSIDFLSGGGIKIDIASPQLAVTKAAQLGSGRSIRTGKLGADRLTFEDGRLYVKNPLLSDLEYTQAIGGREVVRLHLKTAKMTEADYSTAAGGDLFIPSLDIEDAFLRLDLAALIPKQTAEEKKKAEQAAASGVWVPPAFDIAPLRPVADEVEGTVDVVMYVSASVGGLKDFRIGSVSDPLRVPISHGAIDTVTFEKNIRGKVEATQIGSGFYLRPWVVSAVAKDPVLKLDGHRLQLGVYIIDPDPMSKGTNKPDTAMFKQILAWDLRAPDFTKAQASQFTLWAAIFQLASSPTSTDVEEQKKEAAATQAIIDSIELRRLVADLSVRNSSPLSIKIASNVAKGTVVLSPGALQHLRVTGGIPAVAPPAERPGINPGKLDVTLDAVRVAKVNLWLGPNAVSTGSITIGKLVDSSITFDDLKTPHTFTATITKAHAERIRWYRWAK